MNKDMSNTTLAILVVIGIAISVVGLFISVSSPRKIIGAAVTNVTDDTGTTSLTIKANLILNITDAAINLGDLEIDETKDSEDVSDWFVIENEGSIDFDVYAYGASASDSPFTSTTGGADTLPNNYYFVHVNVSDSGSDINYTYVSVPNTSVEKVLLLSSLDNADGLDSAKIGIRVTVPTDEQAGAKTADLTLYVEAS